MRRLWLRACIALSLLACTAPALAQTRAWLDRTQIAYGETVTLNIRTDATVQQVDYRPLTAQFDLAGQTVRRSFESVNGRSRRTSLFAVGIRPRGPGVFTVPALRVGTATTAPLRLTVVPPSVLPASGDADAFVETVVDATRPYVQQAVGMVVRLHVAVNLLSGQLEQDPPAGASLQQVGEDLQYQREIEGRRYAVVERRFLLIPERSGALLIPGARFNGQAVGGFFDGLFGDGREAVSAAAPAKGLQVLPIPDKAPQPWLPLHDLRLRYVQAPTRARAGSAVTVELEMIADGASAAQLPPLTLPDSADAQVFADPAQSDVQFVDGRPRATVRRRIALVPLHAGTLRLAGPRIDWWDADQGVLRTAMLPPLDVEVEPGNTAGATTAGAGTPDAMPAAARAPDAAASSWLHQPWPWLALLLGAGAAFGWWWLRRPTVAAAIDAPHAAPASAPAPRAMSLSKALQGDDLAVIAQALCEATGVAGDDLDAARATLDDPAQSAAVAQLQSARWGGGDPAAALAALRRAFAKGIRPRRLARKPDPLLPPLYPEG